MTLEQTYAAALPHAVAEVRGAPVPKAQVLRLNEPLADALGLDRAELTAEWLTGQGGGIAMAYAGHQFGGFSPQLGDGRAMLLGEVVAGGQRFDIHLKGSGPTPFSRRGDGKAVLAPVLREYLMGEAMHALGVPTTRALAACTTGEPVLREGPEPGAVLARVASSHIRVGSFEYFAARRDIDGLRALTDYTIARHCPGMDALGLLRHTRDVQLRLVAQWMGLGFVHGVMNTDNMTISGETIDYGPCAFVDAYSPGAVFSSIDRQGRYAFANQPVIAQWNLARLAEALLLLVGEEHLDSFAAVVTEVPALYQQERLAVMRGKLGLTQDDPGDLELINRLELAMQGLDFTQTLRGLADVVRGGDAELPAEWLAAYRDRLARDAQSAEDQAAAMDRVNPIYIPRNHVVEAALSAATVGDMEPFDRAMTVLSRPFDAQDGADDLAAPPPEGTPQHVTFCGT